MPRFDTEYWPTLTSGALIDAAKISVDDPSISSSNVHSALVELASGVGGGSSGFTYVTDETSPPATPVVGATWFAPDTGITYYRYDDDGTPIWLQVASSGSAAPTIIDGGEP